MGSFFFILVFLMDVEKIVKLDNVKSYFFESFVLVMVKEGIIVIISFDLSEDSLEIIDVGGGFVGGMGGNL